MRILIELIAALALFGLAMWGFSKFVWWGYDQYGVVFAALCLIVIVTVGMLIHKSDKRFIDD